MASELYINHAEKYPMGSYWFPVNKNQFGVHVHRQLPGVLVLTSNVNRSTWSKVSIGPSRWRRVPVRLDFWLAVCVGLMSSRLRNICPGPALGSRGTLALITGSRRAGCDSASVRWESDPVVGLSSGIHALSIGMTPKPPGCNSDPIGTLELVVHARLC